MTLQAHMPSPAACLTSLVAEVRVQRHLDISEQDAEAEGVRHFVEESHGVLSFERLHGADRAALVCSVYDSSRDAFRRPRVVLNSRDANERFHSNRQALTRAAFVRRMGEGDGQYG